MAEQKQDKPAAQVKTGPQEGSDKSVGFNIRFNPVGDSDQPVLSNVTRLNAARQRCKGHLKRIVYVCWLGESRISLIILCTVRAQPHIFRVIADDQDHQRANNERHGGYNQHGWPPANVDHYRCGGFEFALPRDTQGCGTHTIGHNIADANSVIERRVR